METDPPGGAANGGRRCGARRLPNVPTYEFSCRICDATFELRRAMSASDEPAECPDGHADTMRLISAFASVSTGTSVGAASGPQGGPCGGSCACYPD
jgi:putative FmdB family regulatory protein